MIRVQGVLQSATFDGRTVVIRKPLRAVAIPLWQVASVERSVAGSRMTVTDAGGTRYTVRYWSAGGAGRRFQEAVTAARGALG